MSISSEAAVQRTGHVPGMPEIACLMLSRILLAYVVCFLINNILVYWFEFPEIMAYLGSQGFLFEAPRKAPGEGAGVAWVMLGAYVGIFAAMIGHVFATNDRSLERESQRAYGVAAFIIRFAFWGVFLVGLADMVISFLRVEDLLAGLVGEEMTTELGKSSYRGTRVHYPLLVVSLVIAFFTRSVSVVWLALLVVAAELQIVFSRFIFSYEQSFMGDLVRFWYAALFLFASAYTLLEDGHVRVDILYSRFTGIGKAKTNAWGSLLLGLPLCVLILLLGMWDSTKIINSPMLSYETTQSGFGMYVKYLMAGFLFIFGISMLMQFLGYFLHSIGIMRGEIEPDPEHETAHGP